MQVFSPGPISLQHWFFLMWDWGGGKIFDVDITISVTVQNCHMIDPGLYSYSLLQVVKISQSCLQQNGATWGIVRTTQRDNEPGQPYQYKDAGDEEQF